MQRQNANESTYYADTSLICFILVGFMTEGQATVNDTCRQFVLERTTDQLATKELPLSRNPEY